jgi:Bacterial capsule synthesis protein PGA_cap
MIRRHHIPFLCLMLVMCLMAACGAQQAKTGLSANTARSRAVEAVAAPSATPNGRPTSRSVVQALIPRSATPTPGALTVSRGNALPPKAEFAGLTVLIDAGLKPVLSPGESDVEFKAQPANGDKPAYEHILVPVDRFPSMLEAITSKELREVWTGSRTSRSFTMVYPSQDISAELEGLLGPPGPSVKPQPPEAVSSAVWGDPMSIGIVPFEALTPRLRSLQVDNLSAVDNELASSDWPLASRVWLHPRTERGKQALLQVNGSRPTTNRDRKKLTVVAMTGVTAMARNTAVAIEKARDYAFPARLVGPGLATADITILSNEIPFVEGRVPDNTLKNLILCSKPEYFAALELSGVDAVGLTGNHMNDFGYDNDLASLDFYKKNGVPVYGGGANDEAARAPLILEHHGNRPAFLGANQWGPAEYWPKSPKPVSAWAGTDNPGSARFDRNQMATDIQAGKPKVDLVFAEVQHTEFNAAGDYQTEPLPAQLGDFQALKDAGADVVTGVQAHAPQAIDLHGNGIILHGLGNL